jgi:hypothetical protein
MSRYFVKRTKYRCTLCFIMNINAITPNANPKEVPSTPLGDRRQVRGHLLILGWPSVGAWCEAFGHPRSSMDKAVQTWGLRTDRAPHGGISRAVMRDLRMTISQRISPDDVPPVQQAV